MKTRRGIATAILAFGLTLGSAFVAVQPAQAACATIVYRVWDLHVAGLSNAQIADRLRISIYAVVEYLQQYRWGC